MYYTYSYVWNLCRSVASAIKSSINSRILAITRALLPSIDVGRNFIQLFSITYCAVSSRGSHGPHKFHAILAKTSEKIIALGDGDGEALVMEFLVSSRSWAAGYAEISSCDAKHCAEHVFFLYFKFKWKLFATPWLNYLFYQSIIKIFLANEKINALFKGTYLNSTDISIDFAFHSLLYSTFPIF